MKTATRQGVRLPDEVQEVVVRGVMLVPRARPPRTHRQIDPKRVKENIVAADVPYKPGAKIHQTWWACGPNYFTRTPTSLTTLPT